VASLDAAGRARYNARRDEEACRCQCRCCCLLGLGGGRVGGRRLRHATQGRLLRRLRGRAAASPHLLATLGRAHARHDTTWAGSEAPLFTEPRLLRPGVGTCPPLRTNVDSPCLLEVREPVNRADMHQPLRPRLLAGAAAWFSVVLTRSAQPRAAGVAAERGVHVGAASWRKATHQAPSTLPCAGDRLARFPGKRDRAAAAFWVVALDIAADVLAATESRDCRSLAERRQRLRGRHLSVLPRRADALAHIDLGLAHPLTERLRAEAEPARSLRPTCPARGAGAPPPPGTPACTSTDDLS
jgi:hypothetical protein